MALHIRKPTAAELDEERDKGLLADRRICLTSDKSRIVDEASPEAATLLAGKDCIIPASEVQRLGLELVDGKVVQRSAEAPAAEAPAAESGESAET